MGMRPRGVCFDKAHNVNIKIVNRGLIIVVLVILAACGVRETFDILKRDSGDMCFLNIEDSPKDC